ncbi:MAG: hypothetical protein QOC96_630 [Acidobacteriota bacterium]|jgi:hypothetical protein|nr:hypothetical protein [Acidobacteriota bacterium]
MLNQRTERRVVLFIIGCALALTFANHRPAFAQEGIRAEEVINRIKPPTVSITTTSRHTTTRPKRPVTYRPDKPYVTTQPSPNMEYAQVGLTIWRLQGDAKDLTQEGEEKQTLEQIEANTSLSIGARVRIGIEPLSRDGYLYVIDREQFADGTYGTPHLIFPTLRTRKGNNRVRVNQLIYIPMPPSYFRINPSSTGKTQTAEVLTILLSPTPLQLPAPITDRALALNATQVKEWERLWGTQANRLEMIGGEGQTTSAKAQTAGAKSLDQEGAEAEQLTQDDPLPQTVYRAAIKQGNPLLVTVPLRFKTAQ